ncbi:MAG TPA: ATP synthase F1 subunit epsilon [Acidimicrobiales bacterium]|nr:ATP synthase F1 subunit epsilon [Acidimicrobiales bacterium]
MATTAVEVVSPAKVLYEGDAEMVVCRTVGGEIAFLANHIPYLGALEPCVVRLVAEDGGQVRIAVGGGFVEVRDNKVVLLADAAELGDEIDVEAARAAARDAEQRLRDHADDEEAATALRAAEARLEAAGARGD